MIFPPAFLDEIRTRLTLSDIIGRRVRVVRAGREFKACCPFHQEKSPSFTINDQKGFYHCFGCGAHGDVIGFTMRFEHLAFPEAVEKLAGEAGLPMPLQTPELRAQEQKRHGLHEAIEIAAKFFEMQLRGATGRSALNYCRSRGLTNETLVNFRLGYAPGDGQALIQHLRSAKIPDAMMVEAGLAKRSERDNSLYSFFRDRLIFPVTDRQGRVIAFGGRILSSNDPNAPKYINSADNPLFNKGHLLYNLSRAGHAARNNDQLIVVEGYMDVIGLAQSGIAGAVAPLGTALTEAQIALLWKQIPPSSKQSPIVCFDGDNAGTRAATRALERVLPILQPGKTLRFAFLPQGEDPDSLVRQSGRAAFDKIMEQALPLVDFFWQSALQNRSLKTPEERAQLRRDLQQQIDTIKDADVRNYYHSELLARLDAALPRGRNANIRGQRNPSFAPQPVRLAVSHNRDLVRARAVMGLLIAHPDLVADYHEFLAELPVPDASLSHIRDALLTGDPLPDSAASAFPATALESARDQLSDLQNFFHQERVMDELRQAATSDQANLTALAAEIWQSGQSKLDEAG